MNVIIVAPVSSLRRRDNKEVMNHWFHSFLGSIKSTQ